jgi:anti-anti-sigma factor
MALAERGQPEQINPPQGDFPMTIAMCEPMTTLNITMIDSAGAEELVRGQVAGLIERLGRLVTEQSVALDLGAVERIDAAGIAALVLLYQNAHAAGRRFRVTNVPPRVEDLLAMVGLERYLGSQPAGPASLSGHRVERPAA